LRLSLPNTILKMESEYGTGACPTPGAILVGNCDNVWAPALELGQAEKFSRRSAPSQGNLASVWQLLVVALAAWNKWHRSNGNKGI
jgi:hypothetical protein